MAFNGRTTSTDGGTLAEFLFGRATAATAAPTAIPSQILAIFTSTRLLQPLPSAHPGSQSGARRGAQNRAAGAKPAEEPLSATALAASAPATSDPWGGCSQAVTPSRAREARVYPVREGLGPPMSGWSPGTIAPSVLENRSPRAAASVDDQQCLAVEGSAAVPRADNAALLASPADGSLPQWILHAPLAPSSQQQLQGVSTLPFPAPGFVHRNQQGALTAAAIIAKVLQAADSAAGRRDAAAGRRDTRIHITPPITLSPKAAFKSANGQHFRGGGSALSPPSTDADSNASVTRLRASTSAAERGCFSESLALALRAANEMTGLSKSGGEGMNEEGVDGPGFWQHNKLSRRTKKCPQCGKVFSSGQALGGHMRKHWKGPRRPEQATGRGKTPLGAKESSRSISKIGHRLTLHGLQPVLLEGLAESSSTIEQEHVDRDEVNLDLRL